MDSEAGIIQGTGLRHALIPLSQSCCNPEGIRFAKIHCMQA